GQFYRPMGIAVDANGGAYVADTYNKRIQKFDLNGTFITIFTVPKHVGSFVPFGIDVDGSGYVFVSDTEGHRILKFDGAGTYITQWGTPGAGPGQFKCPAGVSAGPDGSVYVVDMEGACIQKFDNNGVYLTQWGSLGSGDGQFYDPWGIDVDADGMVYVGDSRNRRIQKFDAAGNFIAAWSGNFYGKGALGVACGPYGKIYAVDMTCKVQVFDSDGALLAEWGREGNTPGYFRSPSDVAVTQGDHVYVADTYNHRVQKFGYIKVNTPVGTNVVIHLVDDHTGWTLATLTFDTVIQEGITSMHLNNPGPDAPYEYFEDNGPRNIKIATKALYAGFVQVCFLYQDKWYREFEPTLKMFSNEDDVWVECTTSLDTGTNVICGYAAALDLFGLFVPRPPFGTIAGYVTASCPAAGTPLLGVTIDAFQDRRPDMVGSGVTDEKGYFEIETLPDSGYVATILTPLGYQPIGSDHYKVKVRADRVTWVNFELECVSIESAPRSQGFWKHQVAAALSGKGNPQIDGPTLCGYLDQVEFHFNSNELNQVIVYRPPSWGDCTDKLELLGDILNLWGSQDMIVRARQQLMALLLNVAAGYLSLTETVSNDGATASQAITCCDYLIDDPAGDHERAKDIADHINNGKTVPAGWISLTTPDIAYSSPDPDGPPAGEVYLAHSFPNPFNPTTTIRFELPEPRWVRLAIYDVSGRLVATLVDRLLPAGSRELEWSGTNDAGRSVASGVYLVRLKAGHFEQTRRLVLLR
ncbi:MAG TPA: FlgD immunoglobulin-like domain containing protein, partial [Patescibacteria group bacterium]|nr:FlgD immunoglobulin-like domain containing protein [Patescibacteria group bacterium]